MYKQECVKAVFHFNRILAKRSVLHCFVNTQNISTNDMDTIEYATFLYDTVEEESGFYYAYENNIITVNNVRSLVCFLFGLQCTAQMKFVTRQKITHQKVEKTRTGFRN